MKLASEIKRYNTPPPLPFSCPGAAAHSCTEVCPLDLDLGEGGERGQHDLAVTLWVTLAGEWVSVGVWGWGDGEGEGVGNGSAAACDAAVLRGVFQTPWVVGLELPRPRSPVRPRSPIRP